MRDTTVDTETDLTLPLIPDVQRKQTRAPLAAYVPIGIALIGVALVLVGGVSVRAVDQPAIPVLAAPEILANVAKDRDVRHDLEFLDR